MADARTYIHGYTSEEQERLVAQAEYWRSSLILPGLVVQPGERLLDVGCGAGAVLGVIGSAFPELRLSGIDRAGEQIAFARAHLARLGIVADLREGDAGRLPWEDGSFDQVFMMWFLEHVAEPRRFLVEARRVLRPGGRITLIETDYSLVQGLPVDPDVEYLLAAQRELFRRNGQPAIGRALGALLGAAGWQDVRSGPVGFHHHTGDETSRAGLRGFVDYLLGFLDPMIPLLASELGLDAGRLRAGAEVMRGLPDRPEASFTQIVFRASARR